MDRINQSFILCLILISPFALADVEIKWSNTVSEIIKPIKFEAQGLQNTGAESIYVTYQAIKDCKNLSIFAKSMSSDGVELGMAAAQHDSVSKGDKFTDMFFLSSQPNFYVVLDDIYCF